MRPPLGKAAQRLALEIKDEEALGRYQHLPEVIVAMISRRDKPCFAKRGELIDALIDAGARREECANRFPLLRRQLAGPLFELTQNRAALAANGSLPVRDLFRRERARRKVRVIRIAGKRQVHLSGERAKLLDLVELLGCQTPGFLHKQIVCKTILVAHGREEPAQLHQRMLPRIALIRRKGLEQAERVLDAAR